MRIFVIDDDPISLFLTKSQLCMAGLHDITTFTCAEDALEALFSRNENKFPNLVLLDLNMPVMDGWEFLEALSPLCEKLQERCKIHILTSSQDPADLAKASDYAMVAGLIHKPLTLEDVLERIV